MELTQDQLGTTPEPIGMEEDRERHGGCLTHPAIVVWPAGAPTVLQDEYGKQGAVHLALHHFLNEHGPEPLRLIAVGIPASVAARVLLTAPVLMSQKAGCWDFMKVRVVSHKGLSRLHHLSGPVSPSLLAVPMCAAAGPGASVQGPRGQPGHLPEGGRPAGDHRRHQRLHPQARTCEEEKRHATHGSSCLRS